jgi:hypothetical protein
MGCYNSTIIEADADKVWATIRNFHETGWAKGVLETTERIGDKTGDEIGAKRLLNGVFHETLQAIDEEAHTFQYSIDDGPEALSKDNVQGYLGTVRVLPVTDTDGTFVEWSSTWAGGGEGTKEFCDPIYHALLDAMKNHFS